jgi:hypothetical protein
LQNQKISYWFVACLILERFFNIFDSDLQIQGNILYLPTTAGPGWPVTCDGQFHSHYDHIHYLSAITFLNRASKKKDGL